MCHMPDASCSCAILPQAAALGLNMTAANHVLLLDVVRARRTLALPLFWRCGAAAWHSLPLADSLTAIRSPPVASRAQRSGGTRTWKRRPSIAATASARWGSCCCCWWGLNNFDWAVCLFATLSTTASPVVPRPKHTAPPRVGNAADGGGHGGGPHSGAAGPQAAAGLARAGGRRPGRPRRRGRRPRPHAAQQPVDAGPALPLRGLDLGKAGACAAGFDRVDAVFAPNAACD